MVVFSTVHVRTGESNVIAEIRPTARWPISGFRGRALRKDARCVKVSLDGPLATGTLFGRWEFHGGAFHRPCLNK